MNEDGLRQHYYAVPPVTTVNNNFENDNEICQYTFDQFRFKLIRSIMNDKVLTDIIGDRILHSYSNDLVRTFCTIVENNFNNDLNQCQQTVEFVSRWLLLTDDNDRQSLDTFSDKCVWLLAHVYTSFEYEQNDLISMYSACRIIDRLDPTRSFYNNLFNEENVTRSNVRETFFRLIFDCLWQTLCQLCSNNENNKAWIYTYTFITKYYPSDKVLQGMQLIDIKNQIEFMTLAYSIFLNETTSEPQELVSTLLRKTNFNESSNCLRLLPDMTDIIHQYLERKNIHNSTLMIDLHQWIIAILNSIKNQSKANIQFLFKYLDKSPCQLSLSMKQFLFDELINISLNLKNKQKIKQTVDIWDRLDLIPSLLECTSNLDLLQDYQIPYHPSTFYDNDDLQTRPILLDLYFFHLKRQLNNETITWKLVNKGMLLKPPKIKDIRLTPIVDNLFSQLNNYIRLRMIALLLCETNMLDNELNDANRVLTAIIPELLSIDQQPTELDDHLQLFLSTIITKKSWNFLLDLLKSENIQRLDNQWSTTLYRVLELKQTQKHIKYLQLCHQIQFTLSKNTDSSIFPKLHQPYEELSEIIHTCVQNNITENRWQLLSEWVQSKLNSDAVPLQLNEIKAMLLLNIYYDYYCDNQLPSISTLLEVVEGTLKLSSEELRVFRVFIKPEQFMIGYPVENNNNTGKNFVNDIFKVDCQEEFEISIRHMLVNLMVMILLGGKQSFLWTFVFEPLTLQNTFGR